MGIIIDVIIAAIIIISAVIGWKKGIFRSIMKFATVILSIVGAYLLSPFVSEFLNNNIIGPKLSGQIYNSFEKMAGGMSIDTLFSELPDHFQKWLNTYSSVEKATQWYGNTSEATSKALSNAVAAPISATISKVVAYILLFVVLFVLLRILCIFADKLLKTPVLNGLNKGLGLLFGLVIGLCISLVVCEVLRSGLPEIAKVYPTFEGAAENSLFLQTLSKFNPLTLLDIFNK